MQREPLALGQVVAVLSILGVLWAPIREPIIAAGGEEAVGGAIITIVGLVTAIVRGRVSPV